MRELGNRAYVGTDNLSMQLHKYIITGVLNKTKTARKYKISIVIYKIWEYFTELYLQKRGC